MTPLPVISSFFIPFYGLKAVKGHCAYEPLQIPQCRHRKDCPQAQQPQAGIGSPATSPAGSREAACRPPAHPRRCPLGNTRSQSLPAIAGAMAVRRSCPRQLSTVPRAIPLALAAGASRAERCKWRSVRRWRNCASKRTMKCRSISGNGGRPQEWLRVT